MRMGIERAKMVSIPEPMVLDINDTVMVVGGGVTGMNAAVAAAKAGKHVFTEKPLTLTLRDAQTCVQACADHKVTLAVGYNWRFQPALQEIGRMLDDGRLGKLLHIEGNFCGPSVYRFGADHWRGRHIQQCGHADQDLGGGADAADVGGVVQRGELDAVLDALEHGVVDLVQLQLEKDDVGGDGGELFGDIAIELRALGIRLVAGIVKAGERAEAAGQLHELLELGDRLRKSGAVLGHGGQFAVVLLLEALCLLGGLLEVASDLRRRRRGVKIGEIPLRHRAERGCRLCRSTIRCVEFSSECVSAKSHHWLRYLSDRGALHCPVAGQCAWHG